MRILHSSEVDFGGVMTHLQLLLPALQEAGDRCMLLLPEASGRAVSAAPDERLAAAGVCLHRVPMSRRLGPLDRRALRAIRALTDAFSPDVVHTHSALAGLWGRLALRQSRERPVSIHSPHAFPVCRFRDPFRRRLAVLLERRLSRLTDGYALVSEAERRIARGIYALPEDKLAVIPNGLPTRFGERLLSRAEARRRLTIPSEAAVILFPGRLEAQKDPLLLADALPQLSSRAGVVFADTGHLEGRLRRRLRRNGCAERCQFAGGIMELPRLLRAFDALVLCSRYEGLPYSLLEALAADLPVVATEGAGAAGGPALRKRVRLVPGGETEALAAALDGVLAAPRGTPAAHTRDGLPDSFRLDTQVRRLRQLYAERTGSHSPNGR